MAKLQLSVRYKYGRGEDIDVSINLAEPYTYEEEAFSPMGFCDDALVGLATGDSLAGSSAARKKRALRSEVAKEIAAELTEFLLREMEKRDTTNGYTKEEDRRFYERL